MEASKYVDMFRENVDENTFKLIDGEKGSYTFNEKHDGYSIEISFRLREGQSNDDIIVLESDNLKEKVGFINKNKLGIDYDLSILDFKEKAIYKIEIEKHKNKSKQRNKNKESSDQLLEGLPWIQHVLWCIYGAEKAAKLFDKVYFLYIKLVESNRGETKIRGSNGHSVIIKENGVIQCPVTRKGSRYCWYMNDATLRNNCCGKGNTDVEFKICWESYKRYRHN